MNNYNVTSLARSSGYPKTLIEKKIWLGEIPVTNGLIGEDASERILEERRKYISLAEYAASRISDSFAGKSKDKEKLLSFLEDNGFFGIRHIAFSDILMGTKADYLFFEREELPYLDECLEEFFAGLSVTGKDMVNRMMAKAKKARPVTYKRLKAYTENCMEGRDEYPPSYVAFVETMMSLPDLPEIETADVKKYLKAVIRELEMQHKNVVICAPTGIAAVNIGGITIHKAFGFTKGPCITEKTCKLSIRTPKLIRVADVIIIDEISMCRLDMMDAICASILKVQEEAGHHIQLVVAGDFCQLPPVIVDGTGERELLQDFYGTPIGLGFAFQAPGWRKMNFTAVELRDIVRQQDEDFIHFLNLLRYGDASALRYFNALASFDDDTNATKLTARNDDVDRLNDRELARIPGEIVTFQPHCYGLQTDMLYGNLSVSLKVGAKVIVTTNQALPISGGYGNSSYGNSRGVHNGTLGIVTAAGSYPESPENDYVVVSTGGRAYCINRKMEEIYRHSVDHDGRIRREIKGRISYMPVKPGYVMTIHRSQGQTFDSVVLDPTCWSSGQLYVAISRLRSIDGLHLTRKIKEADVQLAPIVKEFYAHLNDHDYVPSWEKSSNGTTGIQKAQAPRSNILKFPTVTKISAGTDLNVQDRHGEIPTERVLEDTMAKKKLDACNSDITKVSATKASLPQPVVSEPSKPVCQETDICASAPKVPVSVESGVAERPNASSYVIKKRHAVKPKECVAADLSSITETSALKNKKADSTQDVVKRPRGRPARYSNDSKVCRIPVELLDEVKLMLGIVCPKGGINIGELQRFKQALRKLCEEHE